MNNNKQQRSVREREREKNKVRSRKIAYYLTLNKKHCIAQKIHTHLHRRDAKKRFRPPKDFMHYFAKIVLFSCVCPLRSCFCFRRNLVTLFFLDCSPKGKAPSKKISRQTHVYTNTNLFFSLGRYIYIYTERERVALVHGRERRNKRVKEALLSFSFVVSGFRIGLEL